jgi:hypothetical protein
MGDRRTREGTELSGVRRQRSQHLSISAAKIDTNLLFPAVLVGTAGQLREPGKSVNMYDDYFARKRFAFDLAPRLQIPRGSVFKSRSIKS